MKRYVCSVCGYVYEEEKGLPGAGIAPGTRWEDLPEGWVCPLCGAGKDAFRAQVQADSEPAVPVKAPEVEQELSPMEKSILCSNLARGCEKQYLSQEAEDFARLAEYFRAQAEPQAGAGLDRILDLVKEDLQARYPYAGAVSRQEQDRGAQRALVWSEKVSNMLSSLLERYAREGEAMLEGSSVYVCSICGFLYVGEEPPQLCPVCKVPSWKFEKAEGRAM